MQRWVVIMLFLVLALMGMGQETRIVDSLQNVLATQEGEERVKTMLELAWDFYDISFDECISWGETALKEANTLGYKYLEAEAYYTLGIQYGYHGDLDMAAQHLKKAYSIYILIDDSQYIKENGWDFSSTKYAFVSLWQLATYELTLGNIDTAYQAYEKALPMAESMNDTSACAYIVSNMGLIEYKRNLSEKALHLYDQADRMFRSIGDERMSLRMESNMATICYESGQTLEARKLFWRVIPKLEQYEDYYSLVSICSNMGMIYGNDVIDYDSAMYYFQKALYYTEVPIQSKDYEVLVRNEKSEVMVQIADLLARRGENKESIAKYEEALRLAEESAYLYGQMGACMGLGKVYGEMGQAAKSLHYFRCFMELEEVTGVKMMRPSVQRALVMDYARLGMFSELESELADFEENNASLLREMADVNEQNKTLREESMELYDQYESQGKELLEERAKAHQYRLAFFGLLALVLSTAVLLSLYKIVRKKQSKIEKV